MQLIETIAVLLDYRIKNQLDAIKGHKIHACVVVSVGVIFVIGNFFINVASMTAFFKNFLGLGGLAISLISTYPINQIITRKEKLRECEQIKQVYRTFSEPDLIKLKDKLVDVKIN